MGLRVFKSVETESGFPVLVTSSKVHLVCKVLKVHDLTYEIFKIGDRIKVPSNSP